MADWTTFFTDMGSVVRLHNAAEDVIKTSLLQTEISTVQTNFNSDKYERVVAADFLRDLSGQISSITSFQSTWKSRADDIIKQILKASMASGKTSVTDLLDEAIDAFQDAAQSIKGNVNYSYTETGDTNSEMSLWSITGVTRDLSSSGNIYAKLSKPGDYLLEIFADSGQTYSIGIASLASTTATGTMTIGSLNSSGIAGSALMTYNNGEAAITLRMLGVEDADNQGTGNVSLITTSQTTKTETWTLECATAATASAVSRWNVYRSEGSAASQLTAGTAYSPTDGEFTLTLSDPDLASYTDYNDGGSQLSSWTISGQTLSNTARLTYTAGQKYSTKGLLYAKLYASGAQKILEIYDDAGLAAGDMVAKGSLSGTASGTASGTITMTAQNSSGLTGAVTVNYSGDDLDIVLVINLPWVVGDRITFVLTSDDGGLFQSYFRDKYKKTWNSVTDGTQTIADTLAA